MSLGTSLHTMFKMKEKFIKLNLARHHNYKLKCFVKNKVVTEDSTLTHVLAYDCRK